MAVKLSRSDCHGGPTSDKFVSTVLQSSGIPEPQKKKPQVDFLFDTVVHEGPFTKDEFSGITKPGVLTTVVTNGREVVVGRCPVCGVMGMWPGAKVTGKEFPSSSFKFKCNCPRCSGKWTVKEGRIE